MAEIRITRVGKNEAGYPTEITYHVTKDGQDISGAMLIKNDAGNRRPSYALSRALTQTDGESTHRGIFTGLETPSLSEIEVRFHRKNKGYVDVTFAEALDSEAAVDSSDYFRILNDRIAIVKNAFLAKYPDTNVLKNSATFTVAADE